MPSRFLREGILDSEAVNSLSWPAEVFYRRLMSAVDDYGRFDGRISVLRSRLYPTKVEFVREADISRWIAECVKAGLIALYAVDSKPYILFGKLGEPRAKNPKFPSPPDGLNASVSICKHLHTYENGCKQMNTDVPPSPSPSPSPSPPPYPPAGAKRERTKPPKAEHPHFAAFWQAYPRRTARDKAAEAFARIDPDESTLAAILAAIAEQKRWDQWTKDGGQYIPHPATWLNQRRWADEPPPNLRPAGPATSTVIYDQ